jgi:uncharacterized membrane protein
MWHIAENAASCIGFLSLGARDEGHGGPTRAMIAQAVGEAVVLSAHGERAAMFAESVEIRTARRFVGMGMVTIAEKLAGHGAIGTAQAVVDAGAEAWQGFASFK